MDTSFNSLCTVHDNQRHIMFECLSTQYKIKFFLYYVTYSWRNYNVNEQLLMGPDQVNDY